MIVTLLADGFEEIEAVTIIDLLRRSNIKVKSVSIMGRKNVRGAHDIEITADTLFENIDFSNCEMIIMPGGARGAQHLDNHPGVAKKLQEFSENGKWIAAICAAPMILGHHGLINGKRVTIFKGMEDELTGADYIDEKVVVDRKIITSQGPATAMVFALKIIELIKGEDESRLVSEALMM